MILSAIAAKLKQRAKADFRGRHFEAALIVQAVSWYLRYPLSYRDIEELFLERGLEVDHSTLNRWVLAYAPLIEKRLRQFRRPHCGSVRIDETYVKVRGEWRYLYRAIDKHGAAVDFLLTANRDLDAANRACGKRVHGRLEPRHGAVGPLPKQAPHAWPMPNCRHCPAPG
jgi:IS6 family transposase